MRFSSAILSFNFFFAREQIFSYCYFQLFFSSSIKEIWYLLVRNVELFLLLFTFLYVYLF